MRVVKSAVVICAAFMALQANAIPISTSVGDFEVTTVEGTQFSHAALLMEQVWLGNEELALEFASLAGPDLEPLTLFGWRLGTLTPLYFPLAVAAHWTGTEARSVVVNADTSIHTWAIARPISVPEPATLTLLAAGLIGVGFARGRKS